MSLRGCAVPLRYVLRGVLLCSIALALAGCGKDKDTTAGYQGKPDIHPWDSPEAEWERQIETRTLNQNEYTRTR
jgi:hypothetical protein